MAFVTVRFLYLIWWPIPRVGCPVRTGLHGSQRYLQGTGAPGNPLSAVVASWWQQFPQYQGAGLTDRGESLAEEGVWHLSVAAPEQQDLLELHPPHPLIGLRFPYAAPTATQGADAKTSSLQAGEAEKVMTRMRRGEGAHARRWAGRPLRAALPPALRPESARARRSGEWAGRGWPSPLPSVPCGSRH